MDYIKLNQQLWNNRTQAHYESDFYDVEGFLKGKESLNPPELELLGELKGKKVLHLQCHFGQDTLALARLGAEATGVDFSEKGMEKARELSRRMGVNARFILSDVYSLPEKLNETFDIVFTSYGTVGWLPDMQQWAKVISRFLKAGGSFVMAEFHPVVWMFSSDFQRIEYKYTDNQPIIETSEGSYTEKPTGSNDKFISRNHGLAKVLDALIKAGLQITDFKEYDYSPYNCFKNTVEIDRQKFQIKDLEGKIPMMYTLKAIK